MTCTRQAAQLDAWHQRICSCGGGTPAGQHTTATAGDKHLRQQIAPAGTRYAPLTCLLRDLLHVFKPGPFQKQQHSVGAVALGVPEQ